METHIEKLLLLASLCEQQTLTKNQETLTHRQLNALKKLRDHLKPGKRH